MTTVNYDQKEYWKHIKQLPLGYEVSSLGRVRIDYGDHYEPVRIGQSGGYANINALGKQYLLHVLVAEAFLPNPDNFPQVSHIDGNKSNNCVRNLVWTDPSINMTNAYKRGQQTGKQVVCITDKLAFATLQSAEMFYGICRLAIERSATTGQSCFGKHFEFLDRESFMYPENMIYISLSDYVELLNKFSTLQELQNHVLLNSR